MAPEETAPAPADATVAIVTEDPAPVAPEPVVVAEESPAPPFEEPARAVVVMEPEPVAPAAPPAPAADDLPRRSGPGPGDIVPFRGYESGGSTEHPAIVTGVNADGSVDLTVFFRRSPPAPVSGAIEDKDGYFTLPAKG